MSDSLATHVESHVLHGSEDRSGSLGIRKMPDGYALMLNPDQSHFYWLREDGAESAESWSLWAVWRGAMENAKFREGRA